MTTQRKLIRVAIPPLVMAALLFIPKLFHTLNTPDFTSALIFLVIFSFTFFWGCVWLSGAVCRFVGVTRPAALLFINAVVQFLLTALGSASVRNAMHSPDWRGVARDSLEQTVAFVAAYLVYRILKQPLALAPSPPPPNHRSRVP